MRNKIFAALMLVVICACGYSQAGPFVAGELLTAAKLNAEADKFSDYTSGAKQYLRTYYWAPSQIAHGTSAFSATGSCNACHIAAGVMATDYVLSMGRAGTIDLGPIYYTTSSLAISGSSGKIPVYANNTGATAAGKTAGTLYRTADGTLKIVY
jgi:hypothetical protein